MKCFIKGVFIGLLVLGLVPDVGNSCTTFRIDLDNQFYFGRNFDWMAGDSILVVNKRGVTKKAALSSYDKGQPPASWTSKYGSVTFNLYGRDFPTGGMNEAGLVVETMLLPDGKYPDNDSRLCVKSTQWRQYHLDIHTTVDEVIASDSDIRILPYRHSSTVHFLVSDKTGKCAVIEFLDGKMVVYTGDSMPVMALANSRYAESLEYWKKGAAPEPDKWKSFTRFIQAADMVKAYGAVSGPPVDYAFEILRKVSSPVMTQWSIVYDQNNLRLHFITAANAKIRTVDLSKFDFSCRTEVKILDVTADLSGDVTDQFRDYTQQINREVIGGALASTPGLESVPTEVIDRISSYPNSTTCEK